MGKPKSDESVEETEKGISSCKLFGIKSDYLKLIQKHLANDQNAISSHSPSKHTKSKTQMPLSINEMAAPN